MLDPALAFNEDSEDDKEEQRELIENRKRKRSRYTKMVENIGGCVWVYARFIYQVVCYRCSA